MKSRKLVNIQAIMIGLIGLIVMTITIISIIPRRSIIVTTNNSHLSDKNYFSIHINATYTETPMPSFVLQYDIFSSNTNSISSEEICINDSNFFIDEISNVFQAGETVYHDTTGSGQSFGEPIACVKNGVLSNFTSDAGLSTTIDIALEAEPYLYPYDSEVFGLSAYFKGFTGKENLKTSTEIPVEIKWTIYNPNGELTYFTGPTRDNKHMRVIIETQRPILFRIVAPLLIGLPFTLISFLPYIKGISEFTQSSVGIVFSLWTIRQILLPVEMKGTTLLDACIIGLYIFLALSVLFWLYLRRNGFGETATQVNSNLGTTLESEKTISENSSKTSVAQETAKNGNINTKRERSISVSNKLSMRKPKKQKRS